MPISHTHKDLTAYLFGPVEAENGDIRFPFPSLTCFGLNHLRNAEALLPNELIQIMRDSLGRGIHQVGRSVYVYMNIARYG